MKKVLIVDDATFMRISLRCILEKNGFEVIGEGKNGVEAISKYIDLRPDILTLDITMPEKNGIEVLKEIINIDPKANVVIISALGQETFVTEAVKLGAKGFLVKPFKEDFIIRTLSKL
ncbi:response regulator [Serpentinicella alkaliphila]|uniref:Stage 0 sporulation protein A homolog n=1 Tax=Serpentinicella alkaliphila TaxID=1734049 RepID=A0A4R2TDF9_9FIRM|nr:response regulator [Serpentinicella alkaliphila]QUH24989.1 response regulator [Serpentinicella alkaliphila]TCP95168.1 two-component system chemotaxis response regulator CheY [Serpentinicella alkaliphila]